MERWCSAAAENLRELSSWRAEGGVSRGVVICSPMERRGDDCSSGGDGGSTVALNWGRIRGSPDTVSEAVGCVVCVDSEAAITEPWDFPSID